MEQQRKEHIESLAAELAKKGYDDFVRIANVGRFAPVREALDIYFERRDRERLSGPSPPLRLYMMLQSVSPDKPYSSITIQIDESMEKGLVPSSYTLRRMSCWEGEQTALIERNIAGSKELPTAREAKEMLLESEEKKRLSSGKRLR